jgi:microcystin-dependent protein
MENPFIGEVVFYAFNYAPQGWAPCAGQLLAISQDIPLFEVIDSKFGGNNQTVFALPDYRDLTSHLNGLQYCIALSGTVPSASGPSRPQSLGEIASLPYGFAPNSWVECNGQLLQIAENQALFQVIGTTFGGDGKITFGVPNLILFSPTPPTPGTDSQYFIAAEGGPAPVDPFVAEVRLFPSNAAPNGWESCSGQVLRIAQNQELFALLGFTFGGDGRTTFALPDMSGPPVPAGVEYCIAIAGTFPTRSPQFEEAEVIEETEESLPESIGLPDEESA